MSNRQLSSNFVKAFNKLMQTFVQHSDPDAYYSDIIYDAETICEVLKEMDSWETRSMYLYVRPYGTHLRLDRYQLPEEFTEYKLVITKSAYGVLNLKVEEI